MGEKLRLKDIRAMYRLIGDLRTVGSDPAKWRTHLVRRLHTLFDAAIVVSSEIHVQTITGQAKDGKLRVIDVGWGCDGSKDIWQIQTDSEARPEEFMLALLPSPEPDVSSPPEVAVPVLPTTALRGGTTFVLSQYPLPHIGAVDQLGIHKDSTQEPFTPVQHRLIRLFHVELGRLWKKDALDKARDPNSALPPRLAQTLEALQAGCSEKQVSLRLGISKHTVHNYVKALHQRLGVSSRGELLAKKAQSQPGFLPQFSVRR
jgi:DNA-binding CsgD family transcriptional regulator